MKVFIGSSKEAQKELREVEEWIQKAGLIAIPWDKPTLFPPGENTFLRLIEISKEVDAAVFIFSEDDKIWYRNDSALQPRDNILIEYGLFSGILGPTRTVLCRKGTPKLATDILGIQYIDISSNKALARTELKHWAQNLLGFQSNLARIWENRHEIQPSLSARIRDSKKEIFFVGFSLKSTFDHHRNILTKILHRNSRPRIRILMVHPNSLHAKAHETFSDRNVRKEIRGVLHQMESFYNDLDQDAKNNIDIRLTHYLPRFAAKVFDYKTILLNLYMYRSRAQENLAIEITKSKHEIVFNNVIKNLENLFNHKMNHKYANHKLIINGKWNQLLRPWFFKSKH